jgi:phytoene dehydrogenase-like protein
MVLSTATNGLGHHHRRRGHNGLVTAAYLARAGQRTLVLEARDRVGGAAVTEEPWPGFRVSTAAYVVSLFRPEIVRDLDLGRHGYQLLPRDPSSFTPLPGRPLPPDGTRPPAERPGGVEVLATGRGTAPGLRGDAGADRRGDRADHPRDTCRSVLAAPGDLFRLARMGLRFLAWGRTDRERWRSSPLRRAPSSTDGSSPTSSSPRSRPTRSSEPWPLPRRQGPPTCSFTT